MKEIDNSMVQENNLDVETIIQFARETLSGKQSLLDISSKYGIPPGLIYLWKKKMIEGLFVLLSDGKENAHTKKARITGQNFSNRLLTEDEMKCASPHPLDH